MIYLRVALTDVIVKKKKRGLLAYTPVGAVVKVGRDALKEAFDKVDFIETTFQAELVDSMSNDVLAALVAQRGQRKAEGQKETRIDMDADEAEHARLVVAAALPARQFQAARGQANELRRRPRESLPLRGEAAGLSSDSPAAQLPVHPE